MSELGFNVPPKMRSSQKGPQFKVSPERPEKPGIDNAISDLIVQLVIHSITVAPAPRWEGLVCGLCTGTRFLSKTGY